MTDRVLPERVAVQFRAGATVTWNSLNRYRPNLRALAASLSTLPAPVAVDRAAAVVAPHQGRRRRVPAALRRPCPAEPPEP